MENPEVADFRCRLDAALDTSPPHGERLSILYHEARESEANSLILIMGSTWAPKSELAFVLQESVEDDERGYFVCGSFHSINLIEPHAALFSVVTSLVQQVNARGEEEASAVRSDILEALGDDVALLSSVMPPLHAFLGDTLPSKKRGANASEGRRFLPVLGSFFVGVASIHRPVIVLLENLHLADTCSLEFIQRLIGEHHAPGLLFVATCDTGAPPDSDLSLALREMEDQRGVTIRDVVLPHMNEAAVESVVAKVLECATSDCKSLCGLITKGQKVSPTYRPLS
jgi:predicted ATPase